MLVLSANSKILFVTNYLSLFIIYHIHGMIYRVLSAPCVYISVHNRNVQGAARQTSLVRMHQTPALHSPGAALVPPTP